MTGARAALVAARAAAEVARREPTEANVRAVREAVARVERRADDLHRPRPTASPSPRAALAKAKAAAATAKKNPTPENVKAAQQAVGAARARPWPQRAPKATRADGPGYNPNRDSDGKFAPGPHAERARPGGDIHGRAMASLQDHAFVAQHAERLSRAGDEARRNFPRDPHGDGAARAAANHIHGEAMRIHAEEEAHGGDAHLHEAADDARGISRARGGDLIEQHAAAMDAIASAKRDAEEQRGQRAAEDKAIAAGHLSSEPRSIADQYIAGDDARRLVATQHVETLDRAHGAAADKLAELHAYGSEEHKNLDTDHIIRGEHFNDAQQALHDAVGKPEHGGYERSVARRELPVHPDEADLNEGELYQPYGHEPHPDEVGFLSGEAHQAQLAAHEASVRENAPFAHHRELEYVPHPDQAEDVPTGHEYDRQFAAHEAWRGRAEAAYNEALDAHRAEFKRRAEAAQTALENLHAQQVATRESLRASAKEGDRSYRNAQRKLEEADPEDFVNHAAFAHHERNYGEDDPDAEGAKRDPQYLVDARARGDYEAAHTAADTMIGHAIDRIDNHGHFEADSALGEVKDSTRATRDSIRALSRITGWTPKL